MNETLWIVMPARNEEVAIAGVVDEWMLAIRASGASFRFLVVDDGSTDGTARSLRELAAKYPELVVIAGKAQGHGQACVLGYRHALAAGAAWVLQLDSDGQCDPRHWPAFWSSRHEAEALVGFRRTRDDGTWRRIGSYGISAIAWLARGTWFSDANVPYRLMTAAALREAIADLPAEFHLANVLVSLRLAERRRVARVPIGFRVRHGGESSSGLRSYPYRARQLYRQLHAIAKPKSSLKASSHPPR